MRHLARRKTDIFAEIEWLESVSRTPERSRRLWHLRNVLVLRERRRALIRQLGARCAVCGARNRAFEFDHYPAASPVDLSRLNQSKRQDHYEECASSGGLRLLCATCNRVSGGYLGALRRGYMADGEPTPLLQGAAHDSV